ncbi:MAG: flagellar filament capping protein FliD [Treponema sp.]|jgi:flagellar hook-associated protein 2|nr:flagellar filament capping protein FliD [Treponema sp.]
MSDVYIPGIKSQFNSEKLIDDLMKLERIPKERTEKNIENLEVRKGYWQELGRRVSSLRESARLLYSFQNPFNERTALSADESVLTAAATREAAERTYSFTVKQTAQADRFLSSPLDEKFRIESGTYAFSVGNSEISFNFRDGSLREFVDFLNRRGQDKLGASLITVRPGTKSLLIESRVSGAENRLGFSGAAADLAVNIGMMEQRNDTRRDIAFSEAALRKNEPVNARAGRPVTVKDGIIEVPAQNSVSALFSVDIPAGSPLYLKIETATETQADTLDIPQPPPGPAVPAGSVSYGGIVVENDPSHAPLPEWTPPPVPERVDNMAVLSLSFSDGSGAALPPITDTSDFAVRQYRLADVAAGKTITALNIANANTHRDISVRNAEIFDPAVSGGGLRPVNPVSTAQDAIITMEGIELQRPGNTISDIIPGVTVTARGPSSRPVQLEIRPDREAVKDALISLAGNYNRLMAEINVLTRADASIIDELSYLSADEAEEMRKRLGVFSGDTTLNQFKGSLQRAATAPYPAGGEGDLVMLAQIGIGTNTRTSGGSGYDPSRLRGYLEIDEKVLDAALETKLPAIRQLFGSDTDGDLIMDSGAAVNMDALAKPFVDTGGIVALKTTTLDSRISQDRGRIETMERRLASKEAELKLQYGRMEGAYARMEQMFTSLDNFSQRNSGNNR